jgi:hypothetical protein
MGVRFVIKRKRSFGNHALQHVFDGEAYAVDEFDPLEAPRA